MRRAQGRGCRSAGARSAPGSSSIPTSPPPRSPGSSTTSPGARARAERGELAFGTIDTLSLMAPHARTAARHRRDQCLAHAALQPVTRRTGTRSCCDSCACRASSCRRCATAAAISAAPQRSCWALKFPSAAWPAISRRRSSARAALSAAWRSPLTAQVVFCSSTPAMFPSPPNTCSRPWPIGSAGVPPTLWKGRSSSPARPSSGCAMACTCCATRPNPPRPRRALPMTTACTWCRRSWASARRTGSRTRADSSAV